MSNTRLLASQGIAIVALGLALMNDLGLSSMLGISPRTPGILALVLAIVAFGVAVKDGSVMVSASLIIQGAANIVTAVTAGAVIGVPFGLVVLVLGLVKAAITLRASRKISVVIPSQRAGITKAALGVVLVVVVAASVLGLYLVAMSSTPPVSPTSQSYTGPSPVQVTIYQGSSNPSDPPGYTPDSITVVIGVNNTIEWTNNDSIHHTVTSNSAPSGGSFNSGNMNQGATFIHTFTVAGTYKYYCIYHSWMTGTIIVAASS